MYVGANNKVHLLLRTKIAKFVMATEAALSQHAIATQVGVAFIVTTAQPAITVPSAHLA